MSESTDIAILFGGNSTEHDISVVSAMHVILNLDKNKYNISSIYIDKDGKFASPAKAKDNINSLINNYGEKILPGNLNYEEIKDNLGNTIKDNNFMLSLANGRYDIIFPVFHGLNGEDGTIQGLLEFMSIPYVGCGILASALSIDKEATKLICKAKDIPIADFLAIHKENWETEKDTILKSIIRKIKFPIYIKPARLGSSIGITQIFDVSHLKSNIDKCFELDDKIIIEESICNPREITVGVNGVGNSLMLSELGEFNNYKDEFFDFEAKYGAQSKKGIIPAQINSRISTQIKEYSKIIFEAFELSGFARLDFFLCDDKIYLNEINTIPGLETHGTFMRVWESLGISAREFLDIIIGQGFERYQRNSLRNLKMDIKF